ncbi:MULTISPECIES: bifunctional DNA primase/polymerase [unclassified Bradyrhizobium]|uniref:bifunctional DNA primase/polymerase n=1 Tax=unclassified Bradyrhizobium TaxID=2631580 RepID=UPI003392239A
MSKYEATKKTTPPVTIAADQLARYVPAHGSFIPLRGKRPIHKNWTTRNYSRAKVLAWCFEQNANVGVRVPASVVVIDIDPRNGGNEGWDDLCFEYGLDDTVFPCVITGSGGRHFYLAKPADVPVVDALRDFPGVEFKSAGRQVVAAGSIHPDTSRPYRWAPGGPDPAVLPEMPDGLLQGISRPGRPSSSTSGGELDQQQVAAVLARLPVQNFRDHNKWLRLMMSVHNASNGDSRQEWVEWCTGDPKYADEAESIGRRWDSLHDRRADGVVTIGTLRHFLSEAGGLDVLPPDQEAAREDFDDDFEDDSPMGGPGEAEPVKLNDVRAENIDQTFRLVNIGGKVRVTYMGKSPLDRTVRVPEIWAVEDFRNALRNRFINVESKTTKEDGSEQVAAKRMQLADWWLTRRDRYTYDGFVFDSNLSDAGDEINLWRGFGVKDAPGDWSRMRDHIGSVIANGEDASYHYLMRWLAWAAQNPTRQAEVAVALISEEKGTGKGFLGRTMCRLFGAHGLHIANRSHLLGRFNAHFAQVGFLFCDEVLWPGAKDDEGVLKALITEPELLIEPKGVNAFRALNALKLMIASNEEWVVPASGNERRYAVFGVSAQRARDHTYFARISEQLRDGGYGAMLHDLRTMQLDGWHPRQGIPETAALARQKELTADPEVQMLGDILATGYLPQQCGKPDRVRASWFFEHVRKTAKGLQWWTDHKFADFLQGVGAVRKHSNGIVWTFPPLEQMRRDFRERRPWWPPFDASVTEWQTELEGSD